MDRSLIDYLPSVMRNVREQKAITDGQQAAIATLWADVDTAEADQYVELATANGIARWEKILNMPVMSSSTLEFRRLQVQSKINSAMPYTLHALYAALSDLAKKLEFTIQIDPGTYQLFIATFWDIPGQVDALKTVLMNMTPANLSVISKNKIFAVPPLGDQVIASGLTLCEMINLSDAGDEHLSISTKAVIASTIVHCETTNLTDAGHDHVSISNTATVSTGIVYAENINISD